MPLLQSLTTDIIIACWVIFWLFWLVGAAFTKRTIWAGSIWSRVGLAVVFVIGGTLLFGRNGSGGIGSEARLWSFDPTIGVITAALSVLALVMLLWARVTLGRNWSGRIVVKEDHRLVTSGPYAHVRHPIYSGFILLIFSTALYIGRLAGILGFLIFLVIFLWRTYREDALMAETFPTEYPAYKARTRRLIPWVW